MNLTRLFNFKFFMQNIKKSEAMIIFISILLPSFTMLFLSSIEGTVDFWQLGFFNTLFMYVIPLVLSVHLFNYSFKKNSCDFIGSMPLSRKTIFVTNTIGGIALIVLIQLVTAILSLIIANVSTSAIIFGSMVWDAFIFFTVAYILVFTVSNLAISFSGNMFATIVSVLLILFLVPFLITVCRIQDYASESVYYDGQGVVVYKEPLNFMAPSIIFSTIDGARNYVYYGPTVLKMIVFAIIYFVIGLILFNRKKYEMAEESYENDKIHIFIKFLTLTPFIAIFSSAKLYENSITTLFFIAILAVYFFLFDRITNKKLKISSSITSFIVSGLVMFAVFQIIVPKLSVVYKKSFNLDDVDTVTIDSVRLYGDCYNEYKLKVDDKELIEAIFLDDSRAYGSYPYTNSYVSADTNLTVSLRTGKEIHLSKRLGSSLTKTIDKYGDLRLEPNFDGLIPTMDQVKLSKEEKMDLLNKIKEDVSNITYKDYYGSFSRGREEYYLKLVGYRNHRIVENDISYNAFQRTTLAIISILNNNSARIAGRVDGWNVARENDLADYMVSVNPNIKFSDYSVGNDYEIGGEFSMPQSTKFINEYDNSTYGIIEYAINAMPLNDIKEFIRTHKDDAFSEEQPSVVIRSYSDFSLFFTNDVEGFYKLIARSYNNSGAGRDLNIILNENI